MIIAISGQIFGNIFDMYTKVADLEKTLPEPISWVLQIGDYGIYPDKLRWDRAMKLNNTPDDFQKIYSGQVNVRKRTLIIPGTHDDHKWLEEKIQREDLEIAYDLSFIVNGHKTYIGDNDDCVSVVGLGKTFSPKAWANGRNGVKHIHNYTRREVERACSQGPIHILMTYEPPFGVKFDNRVSAAEGIQKIGFATQVQLMVHRSYDETRSYKLMNTDCLALAPYDIRLFEYKNNRLYAL